MAWRAVSSPVLAPRGAVMRGGPGAHHPRPRLRPGAPVSRAEQQCHGQVPRAGPIASWPRTAPLGRPQADAGLRPSPRRRRARLAGCGRTSVIRYVGSTTAAVTSSTAGPAPSASRGDVAQHVPQGAGVQQADLTRPAPATGWCRPRRRRLPPRWRPGPVDHPGGERSSRFTITPTPVIGSPSRQCAAMSRARYSRWSDRRSRRPPAHRSRSMVAAIG